MPSRHLRAGSDDKDPSGDQPHGAHRTLPEVLAVRRIPIEADLRGSSVPDDVHADRGADGPAVHGRELVDRDRVRPRHPGIQPNPASQLRNRRPPVRHGRPRAGTRDTGPLERHRRRFIRSSLRSRPSGSVRGAQRGADEGGSPQAQDGRLHRRNHDEHVLGDRGHSHPDAVLRLDIVPIRRRARRIRRRQGLARLRLRDPSHGPHNRRLAGRIGRRDARRFGGSEQGGVDRVRGLEPELRSDEAVHLPIHLQRRYRENEQSRPDGRLREQRRQIQPCGHRRHRPRDVPLFYHIERRGDPRGLDKRVHQLHEDHLPRRHRRPGYRGCLRFARGRLSRPSGPHRFRGHRIPRSRRQHGRIRIHHPRHPHGQGGLPDVQQRRVCDILRQVVPGIPLRADERHVPHTRQREVVVRRACWRPDLGFPLPAVLDILARHPFGDIERPARLSV